MEQSLQWLSHMARSKRDEREMKERSLSQVECDPAGCQIRINVMQNRTKRSNGTIHTFCIHNEAGSWRGPVK